MFKARYLLPDVDPPGRIYVQSSGLEMFATNPKNVTYHVDNSLENAIKFGVKTLTENRNKLNKFNFFIGIVGDPENKGKAFTLFTYHGIFMPHELHDKWFGIRIGRHFFRNGYLLSEKIEFLDEDIITLLYKENEFRRTTENLEDYMRRYPHLGRLEPRRGFGELYFEWKII